ncbi:MAG: 6-pyruvoyl-tetrahydropterin synthase-related protein [Candidatus Microgenomates bacterium]|jgi:hypothetical protein
MLKKLSKLLPVFLILVVGILASRTLFKNNFYWNMHDDLQMMRQLEMEKCFQGAQIPCRWVPDMGYGYGFPLFNYYPPLPYLVGEIFRIVGVNFNNTVKLTFALGIVASGFTMFFLAGEFFDSWGALLSAVFYVWAPYRAVDVYVRGAQNESWSWIWFPLILLFSYRLIKSKKTTHLILFALTLAALLLSHNIMLMIFAPVLAVWIIFWLLRFKAFSIIPKLFVSGLLSLCLSAFFTLPAVFEQKYVHINSLVSDYFQYWAHYATLNQLFISRFWGDGPSVFGPNDGMAFPVGHFHWILGLIISIWLLVKIIRKKKFITVDYIAVFGVLVGLMGAFMSHERSTFIWKAIPILAFVQFPWRFLSLSVLGLSLAAGYLLEITKKFRILIFAVVSLGLIIFNWNYFKPVHSGPITDAAKFSGEAWRIQQQAGIRDYLPITAVMDPNQARSVLAEVFSGNAKISNSKSGTNWASITTLSTPGESIIRFNIFNYPVWRAFIDGKETHIFMDKSEQWGRIYITVPAGSHVVSLKLYNTPLRTITNIISLLSLAGIVFYYAKKVK